MAKSNGHEKRPVRCRVLRAGVPRTAQITQEFLARKYKPENSLNC